MIARLSKIASFAFLALFLLGSPALRAQNTADIIGTVTDTSGAAVANAKVTVKNTGTNASRSMQTGASGDYAFTLLSVGTYAITVEATGFKQFSASAVTVAAGDRARVDAKMEVGTVTQVVEVQASQAPLLQTDSPTVGGLLTATSVQDLPVNGRNSILLVQTAPGASAGPQSSLSGGNRPDDRRQTSTVVVNGQNDSSNDFLLDGVDNNERAIATIVVKPSIDAIQEIKVETNMYSAEVGRVGGAVITMVTKSGSNNWHGTAFEFLRNDKFDAKDYFNVPQAGNPLAGVKPEYRQNQFGGSFGGPIRKDKTFFFADYEGLRIIQGLTQTAFVPTPCELGRVACNGVQQIGNFSDIKTPIFVNGAAAPGNIIPQGSLNSVGVHYAHLYPTATGCTVGPCPFVSSPNKTQYFHTADVRIDQHFGQNDNIFGRYTINNGDSFFPGALPVTTEAGVQVFPNGVNFNSTFPGFNYGRQQNLTLGWVHILQPNLILDMRGSATRYVSLSTADNSNVNVNTAFGGPGNINLPSLAGSGGLALITYQNGNYSGLGDQFALPTDYWDTNYQYTASLVWTKGAHTLKFGGSLLRRNWTIYQQLFKGRINLNSAQTASSTGTGGNSFASLLVGQAISVQSTIALTKPHYRDWEIGEYVQDDWRVSHWLTLNLGLRYDVFTPFTEKYNQISDFDPTNPGVLASGQVQVAGQNNVPSNLGIQTQRNMFQPRLGFAASLRDNFVIRGGFGTSYFVSNSASPAGLKNAPFNFAFNANNFSLSNSFNLPSTNPATTCLVAACGPLSQNLSIGQAVALNFQNAMLYMYNLTLEKAFGANDISVGWVGEPGRHLGRVIPNVNIPAPLSLQTQACLTATGAGKKISLPSPTCQPYGAQLPFVNSVQLLESNGYSSFNALNVIFQRRYSRGLTVQSSYTYEHALSNVGGPGGACTTCAILPNNLRYDYGNSDYNITHRVSLTANYELPFGKSLTGVEGQLAKGWAVNGIYSYATGIPFTVQETTNAMGINGVNDRPNMVAAQYVGHDPIVVSGTPAIPWFAATDFSLPAFGTAGNEERNQLIGPSSHRIDFSLVKNFPIRESMQLQFRTEVFNITNTPNFATPGVNNSANTVSSYTSTAPGSLATGAGNFGTITQTSPLYTPRQIQFALKLSF